MDTSEIDQLRQAFDDWRQRRCSLRKLAKKLGMSKSSLARKFEQLEEEGVDVEGNGENDLDKTTGTEDREILQAKAEVDSLLAQVQRAQALVSLRKRRRDLQEKALEADAKLAVAKIVDFDCESHDLSRVSEYIETVVHQEYPALVQRFWGLAESLGISVEDILEDVFVEPFEAWARNEVAGATFHSYVRSCLADWIQTKEQALERKKKRIEEQKRIAEEKSKQELEEELRRVMPRLR
jgi:biotin operon repressor